jgi:hypothetical protein
MFKKGEISNPRGRLPGSKNKRFRLTEDFVSALSDDWYLHGDEVLEKARKKDPVGYVKVIASLLPKELAITRPLETLTDDELLVLADHIRSLGSPEGSRGRIIEAQEREPAGYLQALQEAS